MVRSGWDRPFGVHLLLLSAGLIALPLAGLVDRQFLLPLCVPAIIFGIGGVMHIRTGSRSRRGQ